VLTTTVIVANDGNRSSAATSVACHFSTNGSADPGDTRLTSPSLDTLKEGMSKKISISLNLAENVDATGHFVWAVIEPDNSSIRITVSPRLTG
jgi:hypothetical protein